MAWLNVVIVIMILWYLSFLSTSKRTYSIVHCIVYNSSYHTNCITQLIALMGYNSTYHINCIIPFIALIVWFAINSPYLHYNPLPSHHPTSSWIVPSSTSSLAASGMCWSYGSLSDVWILKQNHVKDVVHYQMCEFWNKVHVINTITFNKTNYKIVYSTAFIWNIIGFIHGKHHMPDHIIWYLNFMQVHSKQWWIKAMPQL